jgi:hypothetical protein
MMMIEAASTSETSVNFYQIIQCNNPEDSNLQIWKDFLHKLYGKSFLKTNIKEYSAI